MLPRTRKPGAQWSFLCTVRSFFTTYNRWWREIFLLFAPLFAAFLKIWQMLFLCAGSELIGLFLGGSLIKQSHRETVFRLTINKRTIQWAGPFKSPIPKLNALCYTRIFDTFGRHLGKENLATIDDNELVDAGKDPWEVLVKDVMGLKSYSEKRRTTYLEGRHNQDKSEKMNSSPDAFSLSVVGSFYQWRWTNPGLSGHAGLNGEEMTDIRRQSGDNNHTLILPQL